MFFNSAFGQFVGGADIGHGESRIKQLQADDQVGHILLNVLFHFGIFRRFVVGKRGFEHRLQQD